MYPEIVKRPMDLSTVMGGLDKGNYKTLGQVREGHIYMRQQPHKMCGIALDEAAA